MNAVRRELLGRWLAPFLIVIALSAAQQFGMFAQIDGRFFDWLTVNQAGTQPSVVVIERDPGFDPQGPERFDALDSSLVRLGVKRIGYLDADRGHVTPSGVPVVIGSPVLRLPQHDSWKLLKSQIIGDGIPAARSLAPAQYGINRSQLASLPGRAAPIDVFDAALADRKIGPREFLVPMPSRQNIPILKEEQITGGHIQSGELSGMLAMIVKPSALRGSLSTPLDPAGQRTSEAIFRAHAINALRGDRMIYPAYPWAAWALLLSLIVLLVVIYRMTDPKRLALVIPVSCNLLVAGVSWAALIYAGILLPIFALLIAPWIVTFQCVIARETVQDRLLDRMASNAVQKTVNSSALREGARMPQLLGKAAQYAGVGHSLLVELTPNGGLEAVASHNASLGDISLAPKKVTAILQDLRGNYALRDAADLVPGWPGTARIGWVGTGEQHLFWLYTRPENATPGKSAHLVRAIITSFRQLFRWRADLNARGNQETRYLPIDTKIASAIALITNESEQLRRSFDTIDTAVVIFHLIGSPLHANAAMKEIYDRAGLSLFDASLSEVLLVLTDLDADRIEVLIKDLMLNGTEMRMPMRNIGHGERMLRIAAPGRNAHAADRIMVLEAIDMRDANRVAELGKAVTKFIDLQLRNDFEAILLGAQLASDERLGREQLRGVVDQVGETARRATGRLDRVASLVRAEARDLSVACYPVDATAIALDAIARATGLAEELGVTIEADHPGVSGFTLAEPEALGKLLVSMLRVVIADTPQNGVVTIKIQELEGRTKIRISGGFGIGFDRLMWLITNYKDGAVGEYRIIGEGMAKVRRWSAGVSYWGSQAKGFGFNVDLQGVG